MKTQRLFTLFIFTFCASVALGQSNFELIPKPAKIQNLNGSFVLNEHASIAAPAALRATAYFFQKELLKLRRSVPVRQAPPDGKPAISFILGKKTEAAPESYVLTIQPKGVTIEAADEAGAFYGAISLLQIIQLAEKEKSELTLQGGRIEDQPKYGWRGLMLDESRHFFGKDKVKQLLDWMAFYKLNRFHWHLTDAPGWRFEVKKYPWLSLIGGIGNHTDSTAPARYYTQEDVKEIVSYALERHIIIIPEVDMPGHATAANRAYPQFSGGGSEKHPEFTFHPGKDATYSYLTDIIRETDALFPSQMIHLGGDEVSFGNEKWLKDAEVQQLMKTQKLKNVKEVEVYFMQRMADSLFQLNNSFLAWDEMADVSLPPNKTIIFWWRHDKPEQLRKALANGYSTVLCPRLPLYFDFVQDSSDQAGRRWNTRFNPLESVYNFSLENLNIPENEQPQVLGMQANIWTETIGTEKRLEYLVFPRLSALAEASWSKKRGFPDYLNRLKGHLNLYEKRGIYYYNPFQPQSHPEPVK